jgi:hypothetical protein
MLLVNVPIIQTSARVALRTGTCLQITSRRTFEEGQVPQRFRLPGRSASRRGTVKTIVFRRTLDLGLLAPSHVSAQIDTQTFSQDFIRTRRLNVMAQTK